MYSVVFVAYIVWNFVENAVYLLLMKYVACFFRYTERKHLFYKSQHKYVRLPYMRAPTHRDDLNLI